MKLAYISATLPLESKNELIQLNRNIQQRLSQDQITFNPVEIQTLHMTLVFMGQRLQRITKDQRYQLNVLINQSSLELQGHHMIFSHFDFFPETKKNLIVAVYQLHLTTSKIITHLSQSINNMKFLDDERQLVAHITLGKILSKDAHYQPLGWNNFLLSLPKPYSIVVDGCHLCGV